MILLLSPPRRNATITTTLALAGWRRVADRRGPGRNASATGHAPSSI